MQRGLEESPPLTVEFYLAAYPKFKLQTQLLSTENISQLARIKDDGSKSKGNVYEVRIDVAPETLAAILNTVFLLQSQGRLAEAEQYCREALEGFRRVLGNDHASTLNAINTMGFVLHKQGRLSEAEPFLREALEEQRRVLGHGHMRTLAAKSNLALLLVDLGKALEAEKLTRETIATALETLGAEHWVHGIFLGKHGRALAALDRFEEAETALVEAYDLLDSSLGNEHDHTGRVVGYLADLYDAWGRPAKAAEWRAKLPVEQDAVASDQPSPADDEQDE